MDKNKEKCLFVEEKRNIRYMQVGLVMLKELMQVSLESSEAGPWNYR